ncbi:unnamed protein product, partial [Trichogramma brassicae]
MHRLLFVPSKSVRDLVLFALRSWRHLRPASPPCDGLTIANKLFDALIKLTSSKDEGLRRRGSSPRLEMGQHPLLICFALPATLRLAGSRRRHHVQAASSFQRGPTVMILIGETSSSTE